MTEEQRDALKAMGNACYEVEECLNEALDKICTLLSTAEQVAALTGGDANCLPGQIECYIRPHIQSWIEDGNQPGSLASLRRICEGVEEELKQRETEE